MSLREQQRVTGNKVNGLMKVELKIILYQYKNNNLFVKFILIKVIWK